MDAQGTTLGYWDTGRQTPAQVAAVYSNAIAALGREKLNSYISIKAPALGMDRMCVRDVCQQARQHGVGVHFDSLGPEVASATWSLIDDALECGVEVSCSLPGRWRRSFSDVDRVIERNMKVRVVKGQWPDSVKPEMDLRGGFLAIIRRLAGRARHVRVATHDARVANLALETLTKMNTSSELELLYGLPMREALAAGQRAKVGIRIYLPYGQGWIPYCLSQVHENPRIIRWLLRDMVAFKFRRTVFDRAAA
jgi:proline dehydrogenase